MNTRTKTKGPGHMALEAAVQFARETGTNLEAWQMALILRAYGTQDEIDFATRMLIQKLTLRDYLTTGTQIPGEWHDQNRDGLRGVPVRLDNDEQLRTWLRIKNGVPQKNDKVLVLAGNSAEARYWAQHVAGIPVARVHYIANDNALRGRRTGNEPRVFVGSYLDKRQAQRTINALDYTDGIK